MQEVTPSQGEVESGEIPSICGYSVISHASGDTPLCLNLQSGELYWLSAYKCLYIYMSLHVFPCLSAGARHVRDVKSNKKEKQRCHLLLEKEEGLMCQTPAALCTDVVLCPVQEKEALEGSLWAWHTWDQEVLHDLLSLHCDAQVSSQHTMQEVQMRGTTL